MRLDGHRVVHRKLADSDVARICLRPESITDWRCAQMLTDITAANSLYSRSEARYLYA